MNLRNGKRKQLKNGKRSWFFIVKWVTRISYSAKTSNEKQKAKKQKLQPEPEPEERDQSTGTESDESIDLI